MKTMEAPQMGECNSDKQTMNCSHQYAKDIFTIYFSFCFSVLCERPHRITMPIIPTVLPYTGTLLDSGTNKCQCLTYLPAMIKSLHSSSNFLSLWQTFSPFTMVKCLNVACNTFHLYIWTTNKDGSWTNLSYSNLCDNFQIFDYRSKFMSAQLDYYRNIYQWLLIRRDYSSYLLCYLEYLEQILPHPQHW